MQARLAKFGLSIATEKTRIIQFGRFAAENAARRDGSRPSTFDFLGFTHYCGVGKDGRFAVKRRTSRKKYKAKVAALSNWLRDNRHRPLMELAPMMAAKLRGHFQYYGVNDNWRCLSNFLWVAKRLLFKWLNRRSNRASYNWEQFSQMLKYYPLPEPRVYVNLYTTSR